MNYFYFQAFIFSVQNILDDYERTIYAIPDESLLSLVDRLSYITPCLQMLLNVCCSFTYDSSCIPDFIPCGMTLLNKIYEYLCDYRFSRDSFLKMLVYIFQSCCLAYFRFYSTLISYFICESCFISFLFQSLIKLGIKRSFK